MSNYRRWRVDGGTYFITVVTYNRQKLFGLSENRARLRRSFLLVQDKYPFNIPAIVLLPDHFHMLVELPRGDSNYSKRISQVKSQFTKSLGKEINTSFGISKSRRSKRERNVWQRRFYEHTVRDENDWARCADYIHINPVKHRLVKRAIDWRYSSIHRWIKAGLYEPNWGESDELFGDEFKVWQ